VTGDGGERRGAFRHVIARREEGGKKLGEGKEKYDRFCNLCAVK